MPDSQPPPGNQPEPPKSKLETPATTSSPAASPGSEQRTFINMGWVSLASLLQILNQFVFFGYLAAYFGVSAATDAHAAALALPTVLSAVITGSISYVLVPELVKLFESQQTRTAWQLASYSGVITTGVCSAFWALLYMGAVPICKWLYREQTADELRLTADLLQIVGVQVLFVSVIAWAQAVHHSRHSFAFPGLGGVLGTGASLVWAHTFAPRGEISDMSWAIALGGLVSLLIHVIPLLGKLGWPKADTASLWRLCSMLWPLLLGAAIIRLDPLVDRVLASYLDAGNITNINYAQRILAALLTIGTSTLSIIAFPQLAQRHAAAGPAGLTDHLALALRRLVLLVVPLAIGVSLFSVPIVADLLQRGEFTAENSRTVGYLIVAMMGMFVGASTGELLARAFYVVGDTKTPTFVGVICLLFCLGLKFVAFKFVGIWGIALAVSVYAMLSSSVMAWLLRCQLGPEIFTDCGRFGLQAIASSAVACVGCWAVYWLNPLGAWGATWIAAPVAAIIYAASLAAFGNDEMQRLLHSLAGRWNQGAK